MGNQKYNKSQDYYKNKYAGKYASQYTQGKSNDAPQNAKDCHTMDQLRAWRDAQEARFNEYVPKAYADKAEKSFEKVFEEHKARIEREEINGGPVVSLQAAPVIMAAVPAAVHTEVSMQAEEAAPN